MFSNKLFLLLAIPLFLESCSDKSANFSLKISNSDKSLQLGDALKATVNNKKDKIIDSIVYSLQDKTLTSSKDGVLNTSLKTQKLGEHTLRAAIYSEGSKETVEESFKLYNNTPPQTYSYEIVNTYPHDPKAFTQGLEFHNGILYESTGRYGESGIRKVAYKTGEVLQTADLDQSYFGEGITVLNNKLYQLTWKGKKGFVYDLESFKELESFSYNSSEQGWGLCNDGKQLYKSDGTSKIWMLNAETLAEEDFIQTVSHKTISKKLNELEWANGKIYANNWQVDVVSIINPENGAIEGLVDFRNLRKSIKEGTVKESDGTYRDVLNGIAYNTDTNTFFVTGKNWNKLCEVNIIKK